MTTSGLLDLCVEPRCEPFLIIEHGHRRGGLFDPPLLSAARRAAPSNMGLVRLMMWSFAVPQSAIC